MKMDTGKNISHIDQMAVCSGQLEFYKTNKDKL